MFQSLSQELFDFYRYRWVVFSYVKTSLKHRYRRSYLGFLWTVFAPFLHYLVIGFVLNMLISNKRPDYFAFYFAGAIFFSVISGVLTKSPMILVGNEHYIKKIYVPKITYVLNVTSLEIVNFVLSGTALIFLGLVTNVFVPSPVALLALPAVFFLFLFLTGAACLLSLLTVYFRDFNHIIPVVVQALFFVSPVTFDESMIPSKYAFLIRLNPLTYFINCFRQPLVDHQVPAATSIMLIAAISLVTFGVGLWTLKSFDNKIVFRL